MSDVAVMAFDEAFRKAQKMDRLRAARNMPVDLLSFEEVRRLLYLKNVIDRGRQEVSFEKIVGSLGRSRQFNRMFLPREEALRGRWQNIYDLAEGPTGFPMVDLYFVRDVYFVVDGHHRVSVARQLGAATIEANVKEFVTRVTLSAQTTIEEVVAKSGLANFLDQTGLEQQYETEFVVSVPNGYERLLEHVTVHRYFLGIESNRPVLWPEAVRSWYETIYKPMVQMIAGTGLQGHFPTLTITDLYLQTMDHLHYLRKKYGDSRVQPEKALRDFTKKIGTSKVKK